MQVGYLNHDRCADMVAMIELCGYVFMGTDEKRHKCTLEDNHAGGCYCRECRVGERGRSFGDDYRSRASRRAHIPEEQVIQNWIEQHERKKCPFCLRNLPYDAKYCDRCGKSTSR